RALAVAFAAADAIDLAAIELDHAEVLAMGAEPIEQQRGLAEVAPAQIGAQPIVEERADRGAVALAVGLAARCGLGGAPLQRLDPIGRERVGVEDAGARLAP